MSLGDLLRVTLHMSMYGQTCQNVIHFVDTQSSPDPLTLQNMALSIETGWWIIIRPAIIQQVALSKITVDDITSGPNGPFFEKAVVLFGAGGSDLACQLQSGWVLKIQSGLGGRKNRGRIYVPGMSPGFTTSGLVNVTGAGQWTTPLSNLRINYIEGGAACRFKLVIHGRTDPGNVFVTATDIDLRTTPGCQRRRMVGVGI